MIVAPFQGFVYGDRFYPQALPWADMFHAVGVGESWIVGVTAALRHDSLRLQATKHGFVLQLATDAIVPIRWDQRSAGPPCVRCCLLAIAESVGRRSLRALVPPY